MICWLVYAFFWAPYLIREHFPALAIVERGSLNVERYLGWTGDIFRGPKGGAFINNNPGASLTGAIPLLIFRPLLSRVDQRELVHKQPAREDDDLFWRTLRERRALYFLLIEFLTVAFVMAPLTAAVMALLCSRLTTLGIYATGAAAAALICGLATPVLYRVAHLNHNLLVADAGLAALLLLWDPRGRGLSSRRAVLAGALAGYAALCDFSGLVVVATAALYVWLQSAGQRGLVRWRLLAVYGMGVLPGIAGLMIYQAWAFGSFYHVSQYYMTPTAPTSRGFRGFDWPSPSLIWANFFDPRFGLFAYCPALLLAFAAPFVKRVRYILPRREMWILLTYFALFVLFCGANQYSWLQPLTGFRYLVPVVPALALLALYPAQVLPAPARWLILFLAGAETLIMSVAHENNLRAACVTLWERRGQLLWMIRLRDAGVPFPQWLPAFLWAGVVFGSWCIWVHMIQQRTSESEQIFTESQQTTGQQPSPLRPAAWRDDEGASGAK